MSDAAPDVHDNEYASLFYFSFTRGEQTDSNATLNLTYIMYSRFLFCSPVRSCESESSRVYVCITNDKPYGHMANILNCYK